MGDNFCVSNALYDDAGQGAAALCGDNYSSLGGFDSCGLIGGNGYGNIGMSVYQQGLIGNTASYCNQTQDYAAVKKMYDITDIPLVAKLNYYPTSTQLNLGGTRFLNAKIYDTQGNVAEPIGQGLSNAARKFMNDAKQGAASFASNVDSSQASFDAQAYKLGVEKYVSLGQQLGLLSPGV